MRLLVSIAHHGTKNRPFLDQLLSSYAGMRHHVDVVVLGEAHKELPATVEQRVGLPSSTPYSLPFAHRAVFAERVEDYDVFVYTEDDILVTEANVDAFVDEVARLPPDLLPAFVRYERAADGSRSLCDVHAWFHWDTSTVEVVGGSLVASYTNPHSGCYALTRDQLRRAIASGGFLVEPHEGPLEMRESAASDVYTQCGFRRVVCVSRIDDFLVHHLPNAYLGVYGIPEDAFRDQLAVLGAIAEGRAPAGRLFRTETDLTTRFWDKDHHERPTPEVLAAFGPHPGRVLSIGVGEGAVEAELVARGARVTAVPLDATTAALARRTGAEVTPPSFDEAFELLGGERFDTVALLGVLEHLSDPTALLRRVVAVLAPEGRVVVSVPNFAAVRWRRWLGRERSSIDHRAGFDRLGVHLTNARLLGSWLRAVGLRIDHRAYRAHARLESRLGRWGPRLPRVVRAVLGEWIVVSARRR